MQDPRVLRVEHVALVAAEAAVESAHDGGVAFAGVLFERVAEQAQRLPWVEAGRWVGQRLVRPQAEAGVGQLFPREAEARVALAGGGERSEEHTSELQSLMRISYAVFWLKNKTQK